MIQDDYPERWPAAWFFIPTSQPLGLPDGYVVRGLRAPPFSDYVTQGPVAQLDVSLRVHQRQKTASWLTQVSQELLELAAEVVGSEVEPSRTGEGVAAQGEQEEAVGRRTVLEVGVPLREDDPEDALTDAFERGLEIVRMLERGYAVFTQRPLKLSTRQNLPLAVPFSQGEIVTKESLRPRMGPVNLFLINMSAVASEAAHAAFDESELEGFAASLDQLSRNTPFHTYAEIRRDGWVQRDYEGNTRLAGLLAGVGGEVLLDTLLLHMMWEERCSPDSAAAIFRRQFHKSRVLAHYHNRLGGDWRATGHSAVAAYFNDVSSLRHDVAHSGQEPSQEDVTRAYDALMGLEHYIGDLLASDRGRRDYPRTAMAFLGKGGLLERGVWTRKMQEFTSDPNEPNWIDTFSRWRFLAERERAETSPQPGKDPTALELYAEVHPSGTVTWLLHDHNQRMAALVDGSALVNAGQLDGIESVRNALFANLSGKERIAVAFDSAHLPEDLEWEPEHTHIDELDIYLPPQE